MVAGFAAMMAGSVALVAALCARGVAGFWHVQIAATAVKSNKTEHEYDKAAWIGDAFRRFCIPRPLQLDYQPFWAAGAIMGYARSDNLSACYHLQLRWVAGVFQ
jgi:hypothetical protein